jgi:hypothetical protein
LTGVDFFVVETRNVEYNGPKIGKEGNGHETAICRGSGKKTPAEAEKEEKGQDPKRSGTVRRQDSALP